MGYSLSWAALKGGDVQSACAALGLRPTGKREEVAESKVNGVQLPTGWYLVKFDHKEMGDGELAKLSRSGEVVCCFVEDHVMFSSAAKWKDGKEIWRVAHDGGEKGALHLETRGELPAEFESIHKELFAKQEQEIPNRDELGVDYVYDIPAELAKKLTGFRHDEDMPGLSGEVFQILEHDSVKSPLGRLFGRLRGGKTNAS